MRIFLDLLKNKKDKNARAHISKIAEFSQVKNDWIFQNSAILNSAILNLAIYDMVKKEPKRIEIYYT